MTPENCTGCTAGRAMHPKTMRQQSPQHDGNQQATSTRTYSQRAQTRACMTTEYQERFRPPCCYTTVITTSTLKDPYHPLKGTSNNVTTLKLCYVTNKRIKSPPKAPQPCVPPKCHRGCTNAPHNPVVNQMATQVEDYKSVYQYDFPAWKANKRQPYKLKDNFKVNQPQPLESITSYRSAYVSHPVQPRTRRQNPVYQPTKGLLFEPSVSMRPKGTWDRNRRLFDEASEFFQQFQTLSLETKFHDQDKAKESDPPADHDQFFSTTHADYRAHECERPKPVLPSMQTGEKSKTPFQETTTMKEDFRAWDTPQKFPTVHKEELVCYKKTTFSHKLAESCRTNPKPCGLDTKLNKNVAFNCSCNGTEKP